jgi:hypothetical protein
MKKEIIILPSDKNKDNYHVVFDNNIEHFIKYKEYFKVNNISIPHSIEYESGFCYGKILAYYGYLNMEIEGKNLIIFIPNEISNNQYKWMKKHKNIINRYNVGYVNINDDDIELNDYIGDQDVIFHLYEILDDKHLTNKIKFKKI